MKRLIFLITLIFALSFNTFAKPNKYTLLKEQYQLYQDSIDAIMYSRFSEGARESMFYLKSDEYVNRIKTLAETIDDISYEKEKELDKKRYEIMRKISKKDAWKGLFKYEPDPFRRAMFNSIFW